MTAIESVPLSLSQPSLVKMEDRKRTIPYDNDAAPPLKKQATAPNGALKPHVDDAMPWKDDIEVSPIETIIFPISIMTGTDLESPLAISKRCHLSANARVQA